MALANGAPHKPIGPVAVSVGDPNGIGPEIVLKALAALSAAERERTVVFGPGRVLQTVAEALALTPLLDSLVHVEAGTLADSAFAPGRIDPAAGLSAVQSASEALQACRAGRVAAVVAGPHHETAIAQAGISFSGYPSLVAQVCALPPDEVFLMLVGGGLRIVHATLHESVATALARLETGLVLKAARAGVRACRSMGVQTTQVGLFGINPHASEGGLFGPHDALCTEPAAQILRQEGLQVRGPMGADMLLADHAVRPQDLYVAMFHDQGHIPVKLLAPQGASALSIGADVLLASTGHGSAMDIAGRGQARPDALLRSLRLLLGQSST
jgi:1,2-dihydroxy-3,5-cyclohexadiene-1,4-dicarboxylate dehydrogenase